MRTIGWKENIDFIDFEIYDVPAKIDTGAKTSVLHCENIELLKKGRKQFVKFTPLNNELSKGKSFTLPFHKERRIKNSFGLEENRFIVRTTVRLFNELFDIEISLRDRSNMEFPMLLGRSFIRKKFLVDVNRANLSSKAHQHTKTLNATKA
ncbi:MAG TPA: RimK/LysX family protein [Sphingobacteriaceae bacterium]|nr:RimK/LysX family protein [Sphingobacteriaceae bacterium]